MIKIRDQSANNLNTYSTVNQKEKCRHRSYI